jgi:hypothetical protein
VGVPGADFPYLFRDEQGASAGITLEFMNLLAQRGEFQIKYKEISKASTGKYPLSSYSACANDIALKKLDWCLGVHWETPKRMTLTTYTPIYFPDLILFLSLAKEGPDMLETFVAVFKPFSPGLWLVIILIALAVGFAMWFFGEVGPPGKRPPIVSGVISGLSMAIMKFLGQGGFKKSTRTRAGKATICGFGFLCMLGAASYTANLASFLLVKNLETGFKDLNDAVEKKSKDLCAGGSDRSDYRGVP